MKTVIINQARMTSTRLPGKVLKTVLGKPLLQYQLERLQQVKSADAIVVATTTNAEDDPIVELCKQLKISCYRGSEFDVLSRYAEAAKIYAADAIVRVTSDCPLIDPAVVDQIIQLYWQNYPKYDYVSNCLKRSYPRGMDTEVFNAEVLQIAHKESQSTFEREHVTPFIYRQPQRYCLGDLIYREDQSQHRWTVDTPEDFELVKKILEGLYPQQPEFSLQDCLDLVENHPDWSTINASVAQKTE